MGLSSLFATWPGQQLPLGLHLRGLSVRLSPLVILFTVAQRYIIGGIALTGLKG
jgi:ABC-type maltose transport system permease subunit